MGKANKLKKVRSLLHEVLRELADQADKLIEEVEEPVDRMRNSLGPDVWVGYGADAFEAELQTVQIPDTKHLKQTCEILRRCIEKADEIIDRGDLESRDMIDVVGDDLVNIY